MTNQENTPPYIPYWTSDYADQTIERIASMERALDKLSGSVHAVCDPGNATREELRDTLDKVRIVTSTLRGYQHCLDMREAVQAKENEWRQTSYAKITLREQAEADARETEYQKKRILAEFNAERAAQENDKQIQEKKSSAPPAPPTPLTKEIETTHTLAGVLKHHVAKKNLLNGTAIDMTP